MMNDSNNDDEIFAIPQFTQWHEMFELASMLYAGVDINMKSVWNKITK